MQRNVKSTVRINIYKKSNLDIKGIDMPLNKLNKMIKFQFTVFQPVMMVIINT